MISEFEDRQYGIAEVSHMTGVPAYVLRQWEDRFPQLKPGRDRARRRIYKPADIEIARRIKQLLWNENMTTKGARVRLAEELRGEGRPRTRKEALDILDTMEQQIREMLDLLENE
ncbi:MAG TPA: MerR family transcriptional regulator [Candidatus Hydrogenedentes bacterium]|jgi:DNA-binding transcriptional MerR regulator|nr:MerR family transcriptional regulator [FCB group bacterium]HNV22983.1 MerR family transcriptional regulator [Candidatus Hydrogenedentota bacterium]HOH35936.1 MerR family transcriptional regulator [Candidatus Hydrogenedentota bacterium]HPA06552.1 MerR family transcriptional regulator [Candidatus Hydrogenedentota bacterium]HPV39422.1 MerR family transcriptional regulator [Candidatus Hydrogenedentota bacterium]